MTIHYWTMGVIAATGPNKAVSYTFSKVGKPGMLLKDEQLMAIQQSGSWSYALFGKYNYNKMLN